MKLKLITQLTYLKIAPLPLFLLLSICQDNYGMMSRRGRGKAAATAVVAAVTARAHTAAAAPAAPSPIDLATAAAGTNATTGTAAPPASVIERALLAATGAGATGADKSATRSTEGGGVLGESLAEAPAAAAAPAAAPDTETGHLSYREALVGVDAPSLRLPPPPPSALTLRINIPGDANSAAVASAAAPAAPVAVRAGEIATSPHATSDGATPPYRPASAHSLGTASVSASAGGVGGETEKTIVIDTGTLPIVERMTGAFWVAAGYPEEYKHTDKEGVTHVRVGRFQRALVSNARSSKEADVAHAVSMLTEAQKHKIGIGAPFADTTFDSLQASSDAKCAELEAQIEQFGTKLRISATEDLERYLATITALAKQIELRKQGKLLAAERASSAGSEIARSKSPIEDYIPGDNSAAREKLMAALATYIDETRSCFVPKIKAAARIARTGSAGAVGGGGASDHAGAGIVTDKR